MRACEYCGWRNPEEAECCCGCGASLINSSRTAASCQTTTGAPVRHRAAFRLALTAICAPFVLGTILFWKDLLILPAVFLVLLLHGHGRASQYAVYLTSAGLTLLIITMALPVRIRFKWWLGSFLAVFCTLAFLTLLILRA